MEVLLLNRRWLLLYQRLSTVYYSRGIAQACYSAWTPGLTALKQRVSPPLSLVRKGEERVHLLNKCERIQSQERQRGGLGGLFFSPCSKKKITTITFAKGKFKADISFCPHLLSWFISSVFTAVAFPQRRCSSGSQLLSGQLSNQFCHGFKIIKYN